MIVSATQAHDRCYELAMARLCEERGYLNLAESHLVQARDCPKGCGCAGCRNTRRAAKDAKGTGAAA